jgi:very-short-patch-repair endonuclease
VAHERPESVVARATPVRVLGGGAVLALNGGVEKRIAQVADRQRGRVSRRQLLDAGLSDRVLHRLLSNGTLRRAHPGVYIYGHTAEVQYADAVAALLSCREHAWLSERTAASIWGLLPAGPDDVHLIVPRREPRRSRPGIVIHRSRLITPADVTIKHRLPITTPEWTLLDLAESHTARQLERALDEALGLRITSRSKLATVLARAPGRIGAPRLRQLLDPGRPPSRTRSAPEEELLRALRQTTIERPRCNVTVHGYEVDLLFEDAGVVVELQSFAWHNSRFTFARDHRKRRTLERNGLLVIPIITEELGDRLLATVAALVETITRRTLQRQPAYAPVSWCPAT